MAHTVLATWPGEEGIIQLLVPAGSKDCMDRSVQRSLVRADTQTQHLQEEEENRSCMFQRVLV